MCLSLNCATATHKTNSSLNYYYLNDWISFHPVFQETVFKSIFCIFWSVRMRVEFVSGNDWATQDIICVHRYVWLSHQLDFGCFQLTIAVIRMFTHHFPCSIFPFNLFYIRIARTHTWWWQGRRECCTQTPSIETIKRQRRAMRHKIVC